MTVSSIKQKLYLFIENASDDKIKAMYSIIENDLEKDGDNEYSDEFKMELDRRLFEHSNGISMPITSEESKKRIRQILNGRK